MNLVEIQRYALNQLNPRERQIYFVFIVTQAALAILEIIGLGLVGAIGVLASSKEIDSNLFFKYLQDLLPEKISSGNDIFIILSLTALFFFFAKSLLALILTRRTFNFLSRIQIKFSESMTSKLLLSKYEWLRTQDLHYLSSATVLGTSALITNSLGQFLLIGAEAVFLIVFLVILLILNPFMSLIILIYFALVMSVLKRLIGPKVELYNSTLGNLQIDNQSKTFDILKLIREIRMQNRVIAFENQLNELSTKRSSSFAKDIWIQQIPKYALEVAMLFGIIIVLGSEMLIGGTHSIAPILAIYFMSVSRLIPSLLRIQAAYFGLQTKKNYALMAIGMNNALLDQKYLLKTVLSKPESDHKNGLNSVPDRKVMESIEVESLSYSYDNHENNVLSNLSFQINRGEKIAILGPSGSGKSTLCDILLGLLIPQSGGVKINGIHAVDWIHENPGQISYLPQEVTILSGDVLSNICLGLDHTSINFRDVAEALEDAQLTDLINTLPEGLYSQLGPNGIRLSGGQKQRLGLARALYTKPEILILDESTSALDMTSELEIMQAIEKLPPQTTIIMIAHRLSSIRKFERILYLEDGRLIGDGILDELRMSIPKLEKQLQASGL